MGNERWPGTSAVADDHSADWVEFFAILRTFYPYFRVVRLPQWLGYAGAAVLEPFLSRRARPTLYTRGTVTGFNLELPVGPSGRGSSGATSASSRATRPCARASPPFSTATSTTSGATRSSTGGGLDRLSRLAFRRDRLCRPNGTPRAVTL